MVNQGEGMVVAGSLITADTPTDYAQWQNGLPWHTPFVQMGQTPDCGPHCIDPGPKYPYGYCCSCTMCHGKKR